MDSLARGRDVVGIGALALVAVVIFTGMFIWLTGRSLNADSSTLYVRLDSADRLKRGDPVLFRGVPVGEVKALSFGDAGSVVVRTRLTRTVPASADATGRLQAVDVFGAQSIVIQDGSPSSPLADGDTIQGRSGRDLAGTMETLGDRAGELLAPRTVDQVHASLENITAATAELQRVLSEARGLMGDQAVELSATMHNLAATTANLREVTDPQQLGPTLANLEATSAHLVRLSESLGRATGSLESVLAKVDRGQGTAGRFVNDPALYNQLVTTTADLDVLIRDLKENPGRYVRLSLF